MLTAEMIKSGVSRAALMSLEKSAHDVPDHLDIDDYVTHRFAPGVYVRQFDLPEDSLVVGKIHKHEHLNVLVRGVVQVASEFHVETFAAPRVWKSEAGIKRAVFTLEDAQWLTIHPNPTDTEDLDELEREVIAPSYDLLDRFMTGQLEAV